MGTHFVQLDTDWWINLAHVVEVSFDESGGGATIVSWASDGDGKARIVTWHVDSIEAAQLRAALVALQVL